MANFCQKIAYSRKSIDIDTHNVQNNTDLDALSSKHVSFYNFLQLKSEMRWLSRVRTLLTPRLLQNPQQCYV